MNARLALTACLLLHATGASAQDALQCGDVLTQSAQLDEDLFCEDVALTIAASDVTLSLNGHTINGPGSSPWPESPESLDPDGIVVDGVDAVTILGPGSINDYGTPIRINGGSGHLVKDVTVVRQEASVSPYQSIVLSNTSASRVEHCTAPRLAIVADPDQEAQGNVVKRSVLEWIDVMGCGAQHNLITDNDLSEDEDFGRAVTLQDGAHRNYILDNRVGGLIMAQRASLNIIAGNRSIGTPESAVFLLGQPEHNTNCPDGVPIATRENVIVANDLRVRTYALSFGTADSNYAVHNTLQSTHWYAMGFDYFANDNDARFNTVLPGPYGTAYDQGSGNRW